LRERVSAAPSFAEAWYEMGECHLSTGEYLEAVSCFDRCLLSPSRIAVPPGRTGYDVFAALSKAKALEEAGLGEAAAETYRRTFNVNPLTGMMRIAYARLLRGFGKHREAAIEFDIGMDTDGTALIPPPMPGDFAALSRRLIARFGVAAPAAVDSTRQEPVGDRTIH